MRREHLERIITFGTIVVAVGLMALGPRWARELVAAGVCVWTLPQLALVLRFGVRFSAGRFVLCWMLVPTAMGLLFFYTSAMIQFGGPFGELRLYGYGPWLRSVAIALGIALAVAFAIALIARAATGLVLLLMPRWRSRQELIWPGLYIVGVTIALIYRYSR